MDINRLKRFATEARNKLMQGVAHRLTALGFRPDGTVTEEPQLQGGGATFMGGIVSQDFYDKWMSLQHAVQSRSVEEIAEEAAYTWFNRLVAIRIMVHNRLILPVLEFDASGARVPVIVAEARQGRLPQMDADTSRQLDALLYDDSKTDEQFALLITAFCHSNPMLYSCFGQIKDYTELLLPIDILAEGGFVAMLNDTDFIADEDYESPELIGWLYQFYISEKKDDVFAAFKKGKKAEAKDIPAATQIFTPNWIVKYMVQNTVGRIYLDNNPDVADEFKPKWRYLVESEDDTSAQKLVVDDLAKLKVADLACGSGHILNECFDLLYDLYVAEGYSRRQAIESIFTNNLTGIDIDTRAKQLATFALLLKACQKDETFADAHAMPRVMDFPHVDRYTWRDLNGHMACALQMQGGGETVYRELDESFTLMENAHSLGSIMKFDISPETREYMLRCLAEQKRQQKFVSEFADLFRGFEIILALTEKYSALVMNPPYMGGSNMNAVLSNYVKANYPDGKADLMTVFMILAESASIDYGKYAMINLPSWLFLTTFEQLRNNLIDTQHIDSLLHMGRGIFGIDWGSVAFTISKRQSSAKGVYFRLHKRNFQHIYYYHIERLFLKAKNNHSFRFDFDSYRDDTGVNTIIEHQDCGLPLYYTAQQNDFKIIPGCPVGYWINEKIFSCFARNLALSDVCKPVNGLTTSDNARFVRFWFEVSSNNLGISINETILDHNRKWFYYNKGGNTRKWFGNHELVVNWENNGAEIKSVKKSVVRNPSFYFKQSISWSLTSSIGTAFRYNPDAAIFDVNGMSMFPNKGIDFFYILGCLNSSFIKLIASIINPTLALQCGDVGRFPIPKETADNVKQTIIYLSKKNYAISKEDWDAHETSWDFQRSELIAMQDWCGGNVADLDMLDEDEAEELKAECPTNASLISHCVWAYHNKWESNYSDLHFNEEELNRQFIDIYGLQDELTPDVPLDEVTILQQGEISIDNNEIVWHDDVLMKQFISYAVGCMMGRYSIDKPGLILANACDTIERFNELVPDSRFEVDDDGIIPLMPSDTWFNDNATLRFKRFVATVFGEKTLNENLNFIEQALGKSIDQYLVKDFWKDHAKMYQKRPIYWLFSSKKGAFQCLAYMHRMDAYTAERIRSKYLLPHIEWLVQKAQELEDAPTLNAQERRDLDSLHKQIDECREYHNRLHDVADHQIAFDLDDGVVVNYAKLGDVLAKIK